MKTSCFLLVLFALAAFGFSALAEPAAPDERDWLRLETSSLPTGWAEFFQRIEGRQWVEADFVERRFFPFRRGGVELAGTVWFGRDEGLTLAYSKPRQEMMRIDERGVRIIRNNRRGRSGQVPEGGRDIPDVLLALFRLDLAELEKSFEIWGHRENDEWSLRLIPLDLEESPIQRVQFGGTGDDVARIEIEQQRSRRIELEISNATYPTELDSEERERRFP